MELKKTSSAKASKKTTIPSKDTQDASSPKTTKKKATSPKSPAIPKMPLKASTNDIAEDPHPTPAEDVIDSGMLFSFHLVSYLIVPKSVKKTASECKLIICYIYFICYHSIIYHDYSLFNMN